MQLWDQCLAQLKHEVPERDFKNWLLPLQAEEGPRRLTLYAPNVFIEEYLEEHYLERIRDIGQTLARDPGLQVHLRVGSKGIDEIQGEKQRQRPERTKARPSQEPSNLNPAFTFETFVEGKSNQIARAASFQVANHPGTTYNPLFIYGGVGLGKTHLMHAVGNLVLRNHPDYRVVYLHSERFVSEMVKALQHNRMDDFKRRYRTVNALLIDDVQFFAGKEQSQEEFFHTFNALFESEQQIVLSSDRFPKEVSGLEERLKSRFGWGLTVSIEPPDLETRVAILRSKAMQLGVDLPEDVAFLIGQGIRSNIRELEGALRRLLANAQFTGRAITCDFAQEALRDMLAAQERQVTIENIQRTVAEYFQIRAADMLSPKRTRSIARPRQMAMTLAKELTNRSLPEIGAAFGGRDHTTVLHATRTIQKLRESDARVAEDYNNLLRRLSA